MCKTPTTSLLHPIFIGLSGSSHLCSCSVRNLNRLARKLLVYEKHSDCWNYQPSPTGRNTRFLDILPTNRP
jgi:hypothetical protein